MFIILFFSAAYRKEVLDVIDIACFAVELLEAKLVLSLSFPCSICL